MSNDAIDKIIIKNKNYLDRHYNNKNIFRKILWFFLGYDVFYSILYDAIDIGYHEGEEYEIRNKKNR